MTVRQIYITASLFVLLAFALCIGAWLSGIPVWTWFWSTAFWFFIVAFSIIGVGVHDLVQRKSTILRLYPVIGHFRFMFEAIRPEIQQYFVESDTNGVPISR